MSLTLHFLRHGQTDSSRENVFCGAGSDPALTAEGQAMAEAVAVSYGRFPWQAIYASPLRRTRETAEAVSRAGGKPLELRDGLREISYGKWEGLSVEKVSRDYHDDYTRWSADPAWNAPTGGERAVAVAGRSMEVIEEIKSKAAQGDVLIVSHKATIRILICVLLGIDVGRFRFRISCPVGSLTTVELTSTGPLLKALADRSHLSPELRNLPGT
jgi:broad specificity phosphatase PhoE